MLENQFEEIADLIDAGEFKSARKILIPLAAEGDSEAEYLMGSLYFADDVEATVEEALEYFSRSASQEYPPAVFIKSCLTRDEVGGLEIGDPQDPSARKLLARAAELGYAPAQAALADYLWEGEAGFRKNLREARHWYHEACEQGFVPAFSDYASMLLEGEGGKQEVGPAIGWLQKGVVERDRDCAESLAEIYSVGLYGVEAHPDLGREYFNLALEIFTEDFHMDNIPPAVAAFFEAIADLPEEEQQVEIRSLLAEVVEELGLEREED